VAIASPPPYLQVDIRRYHWANELESLMSNYLRSLTLRLSVSAALLVYAAPSPVSGQRPVQPLSFEDAFSSNEFLVNGGSAEFSPDGNQIAYVLCDDKRKSQVPPESVTTLVATVGAAMYTLGCDVWVVPSKGGTARSVSAAVGNNWSPAWSPDGQSLAFISDRGGSPRLWVWDSKTGAARKVSDVKILTRTGTQRPVWLADGKRIVVRVRPASLTDADLGVPTKGAATARKAGETQSTVVIYESGQPPKSATRSSSQSTSQTGPKQMLTELAVVTVATGEARTLAKDIYAGTITPSPDTKSLVYVGWKPGAATPSGNRAQDLVLVDIESGQSRVLVSDVLMYMFGNNSVTWSPASKSIAYFGGRPEKPKNKSALETGFSSDAWGDVYILPVSGGSPRKLEPTIATEGFDADNGARPLWSASGEAVYAIGDNRVWRGSVADGRIAPLTSESNLQIAALVSLADRSRVWAPGNAAAVVFTRQPTTRQNGLYIVGADGSLRKGIEEKQKFAWREAGPVASYDGRMVMYVAEGASQPAELWSATSDFSAPVRLTHTNPHLDKYLLGEAQLIQFRSADGEPLQATVFLPAGYEKGKRYPMIALVYASGMGSHNVYTYGLMAAGQYNAHLLTTRGYAVISPDIPVRVGSPMRDMMKAVMPAIDKAIELGIADPDRLGVTGQSNGGYSTLSLVTQTNRFKAAVMNAGFGDLTGFYGAMNPDGTGSWHPWLERMGGAMGVAPWENPQRYVENSPIFYLDRVNTPLIIQAGGEDESIVPFSDQVFVGLKRLGKNVIYLRYAGEDHLLERPANKLDYWNRVLPFWDKYLKGASSATPAS
jgi:dipeptidyl aminopeptidase/acylaminoacyl peptidase